MLKTSRTKRSWLKSSSTKESNRCRCPKQRAVGNLVIRCGCDEYEQVGEPLGEGTTSNVRLLRRRKTGQVYATKQFKNFSASQTVFGTNVLAEFYIANGLQHPSVIQTYELRTMDGDLSIIMEYAPRNLCDMAMAGEITASDAEKYFLQLVAGLAYIHRTGFAHRDIKLENVLVTMSGHAKIIDFGTASTGKWTATSNVGSLPFMAPELFTASRYHPQAADCWSLGILYACMVVRRYPWSAAHTSRPAFQQYIKELADEEVVPWPISEFPPHLRSVLGVLLQIDPKQRPILEGIPLLLREYPCKE